MPQKTDNAPDSAANFTPPPPFLAEGTFCVRWALRSACNYACAYCSLAQSAESCVLVRERALAMAANVAAIPATSLRIVFAGAEPALYPFLPDIITVLASSGQSIAFTLQSNGSQPLQKYLDLADCACGLQFQFIFFIHPTQAQPGQTLMLLAALAERGFPIRVFLVDDGSQSVAGFIRALGILRLRTGLDLTIVPPTACIAPESFYRAMQAPPAPALPACKDMIAASDIIIDDSPFAPPPVTTPISSSDNYRGLFCCVGGNLLIIDPDGHFAGSDCPHAPLLPLLWQIGASDMAALPGISQCRQPACPGGVNTLLPKFAQKAQALQWLAAQAEKMADAAWELGSAACLRNIAPTPLNRLWTRLKNLDPGDAANRRKLKLAAQKQVARERFAEIAALLAKMPDQASQETFLRIIKAIWQGDAGWLRTSAEMSSLAAWPEEYRLDTQAGPHGRNMENAGAAPFAARLDLRKRQLAPFRRQLHALRRHDPHIHLILPLDLPILLDAASFHLRNYPRHSISVSWDETRSRKVDMYWLPEQALQPVATQGSAPAISLILPVLSSSRLPVTLDSILAQACSQLEIILIDNASTDGTAQTIAEYQRLYPGLVRAMRLPESVSQGAACNAGMEIAAGEFVVFAPCDREIAPAVLENALALARAEHADVVVFSGDAQAEEIVGAWHAGENLDSFLAGRCGGFAVWGKLFRRRLLAACRARFLDQDSFAGLPILLEAFAAADKIAVLPDADCASSQYCGISEAAGQLADLCNASGHIVDFCENVGLKADAATACVRKLYLQSRAAVLREIEAAASAGQLAALLTCELLRKIGKAWPLLEAFLADYALAQAAQSGNSLPIAPEDLDWRAAAARTQAAPAHQAYGNADAPAGPEPLVSVIMPNWNKSAYLNASLASVLEQSGPAFELIVIDDASTDDSYEQLQAWAEMRPAMRLYRMEANAGQGVCRNLGLGLARGKYIVFADSDDICLPGFLAGAVEAIETEEADVVIFSTEQIDASGEVVWQNSVPDVNRNRRQALTEFFTGKYESAPWGKIFRASAIARGNCAFGEGVWHQDVPFLFAVLGNCRKVAFKSQVACQYRRTPNSAIRPDAATYKQIHSVCVFQAAMAGHMKRFLGQEQACLPNDMALVSQFVWNIERIFLEKCSAWLLATGELPLTTADRKLLGDNSFFIASLLWSFARFRGEHADAAWGLEADAPPATPSTIAKEGFACPSLSILLLDCAKSGDLADAVADLLTGDFAACEILCPAWVCSPEDSELLDYYAERDARIRKADGETWFDVLAQARGEFMFLLPGGEKPVADSLLHGLAALMRHAQADFAQLMPTANQAGLETGSVLTGDEARSLPAKGDLRDLPGWARIYRKEFLRNNWSGLAPALVDADAFMLRVYAACETVLALPMAGMGFARQTERSGNQAEATLLAVATSRGTAALAQIRQQILAAKLRQFLELLPVAGIGGKVVLTEAKLRILQGNLDIARALLRELALMRAVKPECAEGTAPCNTQAQALPLLTHAARDPALTIVLRAHNSADCIGKCLQAICASDSAELEILALDDASSRDNTLAVCLELARADERVNLWRMEMPAGRKHTLAKGLELARGGHVLFVEPEETPAPGFVDAAIAMAKTGAHVVCWRWGSSAGVLDKRGEKYMDAEAGAVWLADCGRMPLGAAMYERQSLLANGLAPAQNACGNSLLPLAACLADGGLLAMPQFACLHEAQKAAGFEPLSCLQAFEDAHALCKDYPDKDKREQICERLLRSMDFEGNIIKVLGYIYQSAARNSSWRDDGPGGSATRDAAGAVETRLLRLLQDSALMFRRVLELCHAAILPGKHGEMRRP